MNLTGTQIREYTRDYQRLEEKYANEGIVSHTRERISRDMGLSIQQADRYKKMNSLIADIQELVFDKVIGMSSSFPIATQSDWEQHEIKEILYSAIHDNWKLTRPCVKHIVDEYRSGKRDWTDIKSTYSQPLTKATKIPRDSKTTIPTEASLELVRKMTGDEFVIWFASLLKDIGFSGISIVGASHDEGVDILANTAMKRNSSFEVAMSEIEHCIASPETVEGALEAKSLARIIERFLDRPLTQIIINFLHCSKS